MESRQDDFLSLMPELTRRIVTKIEDELLSMVTNDSTLIEGETDRRTVLHLATTAFSCTGNGCSRSHIRVFDM